MPNTEKATGKKPSNQSNSSKDDKSKGEDEKKKKVKDDDLDDDEDEFEDDESEGEDDDDDSDDSDSDSDSDEDDDEDDKKKKKKPSKPEAQTFTQAELNRIISRRLEEERKSAERKQKIEAQKKNGKFEELSKTFEAERDDFKTKLDAQTEKYEALSKSVMAIVEARAASLPEIIAELRPDSDDPAVLVSWLAKAEKQARKMVRRQRRSADSDDDSTDKKDAGEKPERRALDKKRAPGNGSDPKLQGKNKIVHTEKDEEGFRNRLSDGGGYGL